MSNDQLTKRIDINIGTRCDLQCRFCYYINQLRIDNKPTCRIKLLLNFAKNKGIEAIDFTGGEPFIREDILELIAFAKTLGFKDICAITNGQKLADRDFVKKAIEAGINDILFSIHGHNATLHDYLTNKEGSFNKLLEAIDNVKELGIPFRTNTVITSINYNSLYDIANLLLKIRPSKINFIFFNPLDDARITKDKMMPRYSEVTPFIKKAIDILKNHLLVNIRYIPFCFMEGYEEYLCNMHQAQYDNDEWDYVLKQEVLRGKLAKWLHITRGVFLLPLSKVVLQDCSILIHNAFIKSKNLRQNIKVNHCNKCKYDLICDGLWKEYVTLYSFSELKPISGKKVLDPLFFKNQKKGGRRISVTKSNKITIINTFPLQPPFAGGAEQRIYNFYKRLNSNSDVKLLCYDLPSFGKDGTTSNVQTNTIGEDRIYGWLQTINKRLFKFTGLGPIIVSITAFFNRKFMKKLSHYIRDSNIVFMEFPYLSNIITKFNTKQLLIYDAHNVECIYWQNEINNKLIRRLLLPYIKFLENKACHKSDIIFTASEKDKNLLIELYRVPVERIFVVPNGVDREKINPCSDSERKEAKEKLKLDSSQKAILFIGGNHTSNLIALNYIIFDLSHKLPNYIFLIVGKVYEAFKKQNADDIPKFKNVRFFGEVSDEIKSLILQVSDVALNPITFGSGTNLKMFDYMAAGLPVVTTEVGARGIEAENRKHLLISPIGQFGRAIEELFQDENLYETIRINARKLVEEKYDWKKIVQYMKDVIEERLKGAITKNITVLCHYPLQLPLLAGGGQYRTLSFCRLLSKRNNVRLITLSYRKCKKVKLNEDFIEISIRKENLVFILLWLLFGRIFELKACWPMITSIASIFNRKLAKELKKCIDKSEIIILEHPYLYPALKKYVKSQLLIYDAHNVEYLYQNKILGESFFSKLFLNYVKLIERNCCQKADIILTPCEEDKSVMGRFYNLPLNKIFVIPFGVDTKAIRTCSASEKEEAKVKLNLNGKKTIVFIGSDHLPNLEALEFIIFKLLPEMRDFYFLIVGEIKNEFIRRYGNLVTGLKNVRFFGLINQDEKLNILNASDFALNPIVSGSGINIKMFDYMASGIPIVTTYFGARGFKIEHRKQAMICDLNKFKENIKELYTDRNLYENICLNARRLVETKYNWDIISNTIEDIIQNYQ